MRSIVGSIALAFVVVFGSATATAEETQPAAQAQKSAAPAKTPKRAASRSDVAVGAALARCDVAVAMQGAGPSSDAPATAPATTSVVAAKGNGLADIHSDSRATDHAGSAREVHLAASSPSSKATRPAATVRMQRKMTVERAMASLAPAIEACRAMAGPAANGTVAVQLDIAPNGEVERADLASVKGPMEKPAVSCVLAAFTSIKFGAPGPLGASLTVPVALVQDRGDVTRVAVSN